MIIFGKLKGLGTENSLKTDINRLDRVKFFKVYESDKNDTSYLKLIFRDNTKISYAFSGQKNDNSDADINASVKEYIRSYNLTKAPDAK